MSDDDNDGDDGDCELLSLGRGIRAALDDGIDPYAVAGVLVEGAAYAISRVPPDEQEKAATILMALLRDRLKTRGL